MEECILGNTRKKIPILGMGTWRYGVDRKEEIAALKAGLNLGMRFIDTAEIYHTEDIVGEAVGGEDVFIATKVSPNHFHYDALIRSCNESLKKLKVKQIDLYQLHWPNASVDINETMKAMEKLAAEGKIMHIGVSNFTVKELVAAQDALKSNEIVSNQIEYSVFVRDPEKEMLDFCRKSRITVIAYSPLGQGALYGKKYEKLARSLESIGRKYNKSASQVALNWLISKGNVVPIPKAGSMAHVKENAGASGWRLADEDIDYINRFL